MKQVMLSDHEYTIASAIAEEAELTVGEVVGWGLHVLQIHREELDETLIKSGHLNGFKEKK